MQSTFPKMYNIPLVGGSGFVFKLVLSWNNGRVGGSNTYGIFVASEDGKRYLQIGGVTKGLPEVEDAIEHFLQGNKVYGDHDAYGVYARVVNQDEWEALFLPNLEDEYYLAKVTRTFGSGNPSLWHEAIQLIHPQDLTGYIKDISKGSKVSVTLEDGLKLSLKEAVFVLQRNPDGHKKMTIKFDKYWNYHKPLQAPIYDKVTFEIDLR